MSENGVGGHDVTIVISVNATKLEFLGLVYQVLGTVKKQWEVR